MLLDKDPKIEELIIYELTLRPALSAKDIHSAIIAKNFNFTIRAIYKELKNLENNDVVYKLKKLYRLRLSWIINLQTLVNHAFNSYTEPQHLEKLLLNDSGKKTEKFTDLKRLDLYSMQLMITLANFYKNEDLFLWCPYQWFHLVSDFSVNQFYRAEDLINYQRYHIFGNDSYLPRLALKSFPKNAVYSFAESPFAHLKTTSYMLIGNHLITAKLDQKITNRIDKLFNSVKSQSDINYQEMTKILSAKINASVTIELNQNKANKLRKKFMDFFGI